METLLVTAGIIIHKDKILLAQRNPDDHLGLLWEFPGGKIELGEHPEECLRREIKEELDLQIEVGEIFTVVSHHYGQRHIILLCYLCEYRSGKAKALDCYDYRWVGLNQLEAYDLAAADLIIAQRIKDKKVLNDIDLGRTPIYW